MLLSLGLTWLVGLVLLVILQQVLPAPLRALAAVPGKYGPTVAGLAMTGVVAGKAGVRTLIKRLFTIDGIAGWYVLVIVLPPALFATATILASLTSDMWLWREYLNQSKHFAPLLASRVLLGGGLGEELGWRGFALPMLQRRLSPVVASIVVGALWFLWHSPAYLLDPGSQEIPLPVFAATILALSFVFTWIFNETRGQLSPVVLFHGALNAAAGLVDRARLGAADEQLVFVWLMLLLWLWVAALLERLRSNAVRAGCDRRDAEG